MNTRLMTVLVGLGVVLMAFLISWLIHKRTWPVRYELKNKNLIEPAELKVYHNGIELERSPIRLEPLESAVVALGKDKAINPRTGKQISQSETKSTVIFSEEDNLTIMKPVGKFPEHEIVLSTDNSGINVINENPGLEWNERGYYYVSFPKGVPTF